MYISYSLVLLINIYVAQSAILLWSNKKLNISPLKPFNDDDFENLIDNLENPYVYIFKNPTNELSPNLKYALQNFYSAYNPNGDISSENATGTQFNLQKPIKNAFLLFRSTWRRGFR